MSKYLQSLKKIYSHVYEFQDQKTTRRGYCTTKHVPETPSEKRFKERSIRKNVSEGKDITPDYLKPGCSSQELEDGSSQESEEETQKTPKRKCIRNDCEDPDYYEDGSSDAQNRRDLKMLAEICDR